MTSEPKIDYESLVQDAMRDVVRSVLKQTVKSGLPGDHHFYISFDTQAAGVSVSKRLREKYRKEMTIVLQHRFWDLHVNDERFEVKLTFDGIPERLVVPFTAIKVFFDPSVRYGLQFDEPDFTAEAIEQSMASLDDAMLDDPSDADVPEGLRPITTRSSSPRRPRPSRRKPAPAHAADDAGMNGIDAEGDAARSQGANQDDKPASGHASGHPGKPDGTSAAEHEESDNEERPAGGAEIVSLDSFRKK